MKNRIFSNHHLALYLVIITIFLAFISWFVMSSDQLLDFTSETGFIENATLACYIIATASVWLRVSINQSTFLTRFSVTIILLAMAAREADLHKSIKHMSMFKSRFWLDNDLITPQDKAASFFILLPLLCTCLYFVIKYSKTFYIAVKNRVPYHITLLYFIFIMVATKGIDRSIDVIHSFSDIQFSISLIALQQAIEEYLELLLPVFIVLFILQYYFAHKNKYSK